MTSKTLTMPVTVPINPSSGQIAIRALIRPILFFNATDVVEVARQEIESACGDRIEIGI